MQTGCFLASEFKSPLNTGKSRGENQQEPRAGSGLLPTSSAANVGHDKDSEKRQRHAIEGFAKRAASRSSPSFTMRLFRERTRSRIGLASRDLDRIEDNGVRTVIVEDASRFARGLMAQELGITLLISRPPAETI